MNLQPNSSSPLIRLMNKSSLSFATPRSSLPNSSPLPLASTGGLPYSASCDLFDDAASTCLELLKGNYFFAFQQSKQFQTYQIEKKSREDEEKKKQLKHSKSSSTCTIL